MAGSRLPQITLAKLPQGIVLLLDRQRGPFLRSQHVAGQLRHDGCGQPELQAA
jgi:hypothetical protein